MRTAKKPKGDERNQALEGLISELAELLAPAEAAALERAPRTPYPVLFIVGAPRSGATLLMQWLASSGLVGYPTNLLARFAHAPAIGARIQRLLFDRRFALREELADLAPATPGFESDFGNTRGALAPNEFEAFWHRFLPTRVAEPLGARTADVDSAGLRRAFAAIAGVEERPFAAKAFPLQYDLEYFARALPEALFVHVLRDGVANARSLLDARKQLMGSTERWYSARPPEYRDLVALPPADQVAGQVFHTNRHIVAALAKLPSERSLSIAYEALCAAPAKVDTALRERLTEHAETLGRSLGPWAERAYTGPVAFTLRDRARAKGTEAEAVPDAWRRLTDA